MNTRRIVIIDNVAPSGTTATGSIKEMYFGHLSPESVLVVHGLMPGFITVQAGLTATFARKRHFRSVDEVSDLVTRFDPELLVYRPLEEAPYLNRLTRELLARTNARLILWIMDDWPERLRRRDPQRYETTHEDLRDLMKRAVARFAISPAMAQAFSGRYGVTFRVAQNGIRAGQWLPHWRRGRGGSVLLRYAGSLAPDMTLESVLNVAQSVSRLVEAGVPIRFEGRTQQHWYAAHSRLFQGLKGVSLSRSRGDAPAYRRWLMEADILLVAYNFDEESRCYTRFSFANKIPEVMAAGAAILVYGPTSIESIRYLSDSQAAIVVADEDAELLDSAIRDLVADAGKRERLGAAARLHAERHFDLDTVRAEMLTHLNSASDVDKKLTAGALKMTAVAVVTSAPRNWRQILSYLVAYFVSKGLLKIKVLRVSSRFLVELGRRFKDAAQEAAAPDQSKR